MVSLTGSGEGNILIHVDFDVDLDITFNWVGDRHLKPMPQVSTLMHRTEHKKIPYQWKEDFYD
jgi:hypothetical protein